MSIGVICIFDPAIFDPNIFTCCGPKTGGSADKRKIRETEDDHLERIKIEKKRKYDEWRIANKKSIVKKADIKSVDESKIKKPVINNTLKINDQNLLEKAAQQLAISTVYKINEEAQRQRIIQDALLRRKTLIELKNREEEEAFLMLLSE